MDAIASAARAFDFITAVYPAFVVRLSRGSTSKQVCTPFDKPGTAGSGRLPVRDGLYLAVPVWLRRR
jgi:hypothetical protein